ncbi:MAG: hypothetical protein ABI670_15945 [Chloroflexota bacterium]
MITLNNNSRKAFAFVLLMALLVVSTFAYATTASAAVPRSGARLIKIQVVDNSWKEPVPMVGAVITVRDGSNVLFKGVTDKHGIVEVKLMEGIYKVEVYAANFIPEGALLDVVPYGRDQVIIKLHKPIFGN